jgi:hypothetical protein
MAGRQLGVRFLETSGPDAAEGRSAGQLLNRPRLRPVAAVTLFLTIKEALNRVEGVHHCGFHVTEPLVDHTSGAPEQYRKHPHC